MSLIKGKMHKLPTPVLKKDGTPVNNKYEFRIIRNETKDYPDIIPFHLVGGGFAKFPNVKIGDLVEVDFSLSGREWEDRCFGESIAWEVKPVKEETEKESPAEDIDYDNPPF